MNTLISRLRRNLFSGPVDTVITLACLGLLASLLPSLVNWMVFQADFTGSDREACQGSGACWVFVRTHLPGFIYGSFYPAGERWRLDLVFALLALAGFLLRTGPLPGKRVLRLLVWGSGPVLILWLFRGGYGLTIVETRHWGGLALTLLISAVGIGFSLPLGVLLALGRRSPMPVIRVWCTLFIELWRAVPLITVLFMASVMLPLFLPSGVDPDRFDKLLRALIGVTLFSSAYMAEVVRGGLQALDPGQVEAARALGLSRMRTLLHVVLPQALTKVIPGIVNNFIGLFKDTTLVMIIGMFDLLGTVQAALTDSSWLGFATEGYVFAALLFWAVCFAMSVYSRRLEARNKGGST